MGTFSILILAALIPLFGAQSSQGGGSQPNTCNSCCQGPTGLSGVPGVPGNAGSNGLHGRDGLRGEVGLKGDQGSSGGPRGPVGPVGPKGSQGDSAEVQKSAFSVYKTDEQTGTTGDALTFQVEQTNVGSHFNMGTDKFTCQIAGTYVFMFTIASNANVHDPFVKLVKDGSNIAGVYIRDDQTAVDNFHQSSSTAILQLSVGNTVWLEFGFTGHQVLSNSNKLVSFSGFLLYAE